ncbi:MAG: mevalonate kinase [bacterium]
MIRSTAPGKVILSGEHAVVYGQPAIVAAVQLRTTTIIGEGNDVLLPNYPDDLIKTIVKLTLKNLSIKTQALKVKSATNLPIGSGLGSSASLAASTIGGIVNYFGQSRSKEEINKLTYEIEKLSHGNPSGVDNTAVVYGGLLRFERGMNGNNNIIQNLEVKKILKKIWLIDSGKPDETTGEMVQMVKEKYNDNKKLGEVFEKIGGICIQLQKDLEDDHFTPEWITENERLLEQLSIVGNKAQSIIDQIEMIGGHAKVCGAGGVRSGSGVILAYHQDDLKFEEWLINKKYAYFQDHLGGPGWQIEK